VDGEAAQQLISKYARGRDLWLINIKTLPQINNPMMFHTLKFEKCPNDVISSFLTNCTVVRLCLEKVSLDNFQSLINALYVVQVSDLHIAFKFKYSSRVLCPAFVTMIRSLSTQQLTVHFASFRLNCFYRVTFRSRCAEILSLCKYFEVESERNSGIVWKRMNNIVDSQLILRNYSQY